MDQLLPLVSLFLGLFVGMLFTWLLMRMRSRNVIAEATSSAAAEKTGLLERLRAREQSLNEMGARLKSKETLSTQLQQQLSDVGRKLAQYGQAYQGAVQKCKERDASLGEVQKSLAQKDSVISAVQARAASAEKELAQTRQAWRAKRASTRNELPCSVNVTLPWDNSKRESRRSAEIWLRLSSHWRTSLPKTKNVQSCLSRKKR